MRQRPEAEDNSAASVAGIPWKVASVRPLPDYRLFVRFVDGTQGEVHAGPMIFGPRAGVFESLRDPARFAAVFVQDGSVAWADGLDLAPDAMYDEIRSVGRWVIER